MPRKKDNTPHNRNELPATPKKVVRKPKKEVKPKKEKVPKPFADGKLSSAAFFGMIRQALRRKSMYWPSIQLVRKRGQIPYTGPNRRMKYLYVCEECHHAYPSTECQVHHIVECGTLTSFDDLPGFVERLFCSSEGLILLCKECHDKKHKK